MHQSGLVYLDELGEFLDRFFVVHRYNDAERGGVYVPSSRPIARLGLALEPWSQLSEWAIAERLDGLFLHRPWQLEPGQLASDVGVITYHLAFDEGLTLGFNPRLAQVLGMSSLEVLGEKEGRPIGMIGDILPQNFARLCSCIDQVFAGQDKALLPKNNEISRIAVVGAMTDALVREAAFRGAEVYITGQLRQPGQKAVLETQIGVVAVGHRRSEEWGLRALAGVLRERWSTLEVVLPPTLINQQ